MSRIDEAIDDPIVTTCRHCDDPIWLQDVTGKWVDVNSLESCAPFAHRHQPQGLVHGLVMSLGDGWWAAFHFAKGRLRGQPLDRDPWWGTLGDNFVEAEHARAALRKRHGEACMIEIKDEEEETVVWSP